MAGVLRPVFFFTVAFSAGFLFAVSIFTAVPLGGFFFTARFFVDFFFVAGMTGE